MAAIESGEEAAVSIRRRNNENINNRRWQHLAKARRNISLHRHQWRCDVRVVSVISISMKMKKMT
jgi:hypothetical protein